ncbi:flagellar filament capping protein FliD [Neptuniibacter sp. QD48_55]|uniref:flagellar filament capping protein FliD n=1 Tax=Neptuniibacter sp. QD48_55 TaxID=3398212 RepID=UPI0039F5BF27
MSDSIIRSLGAGSGIDSSTLVSQLVEIERAPQQNRLDTKEETLNSQISAYGTLKSSLSELQSILTPLSTNDTFNARSVSFPDTDAITPNSVDPGAQAGSYQIEVIDVAQAQSLASATFSDKESALGNSGTLTISFGQWTYDEDATNGDPGLDVDTDDDPYSFAANADRAALNITIDADDSLQDIADKINEEDADVQASVLLVDGQYQLLLTSPSGDDNALRITSDDATKGDTTGLSIFEFNETEHSQMTETQQGNDAELKVNGLTVYRETNEIDDVIQGFNFTLNKSSAGEKISFSVNEDTSIAEQAVRDFVTAYNTFYETAQNLTGISRDEQNQITRGDLSTDGSAKAIIGRIRDLIGSLVPGVDSGFNALTNIGIRTELDGTLSIDEEDFSSAFQDNFALVESLFATDTSSASSTVTVRTGSYATEAVAGDYDIVITTDPEKASVTGSDISGTAAGFVDNAAGDELNLDASAGDYTFKVTIGSTTSETITLNGTYTSVEELRSELQSLINGDNALKAVGAEIDVGYDNDANTFTFTTRDYGSNAKVEFSAADLGADMSNLGVAAMSDTGVDVEGTIDGVQGFGSGNVLLPKIGSDSYGLNFLVEEGAVAATATLGGSISTNFSRGFAGEFEKLISQFLSNSGTISSREESINDQLEGITEDREDLDRKMEKLETRLLSQFLAMERIVSSFQSTGNQLNGILDRLPFTASNS